MSGVLFEDIFDVKDIDPEGKKFDRGVVKTVAFIVLKLDLLKTFTHKLNFHKQTH